MKGFKQLQKQLDQMKKGADELASTKEIAITELLTDNFLRKHSDFQSFEDFENQQIFETYQTIEEIPDDEMDAFISSNSSFNSWQEMIDSATSEYAAKKLGF